MSWLNNSISRLDFVLGWRNLWRNPRRTLLALLAIGIAQFVLIWIDSFLNGYEGLIKQELTGPMIGDLQIHHPTYRKDSAIEKTIPSLKEAEDLLSVFPHISRVMPRIYAPILVSLKEEGHVGLIIGLDFSRENRVGSLLEGLQPSLFPGPHEAVVGNGLARDMGIKVGDQVAVMGQAADGSIASDIFSVKEIVSTASDQINQNGLILDLSTAQELLSLTNQAHEIIIHSDGLVTPEDIQSQIQKTKAFEKVETLTWRQLSPQLADLLNVFRGSNIIVLVLVFVTTISGVANTLLMSTYERIHEIGMLLSLGCKPNRLNRILVFEAVIQGILGGLAGSLCAILTVAYQSYRGIHFYSFIHGNGQKFSMAIEGLNLNFVIFPTLSAIDLMQGFAAILITSMIACWLPARKISNLEPVEALRA